MRKAETIKVPVEAGKLSLTVIDQIALTDIDIRKSVARRISQVFVWANVTVLLTIVGIIVLDSYLLTFPKFSPGDRIIDRSVINTLVGATAVQVGVIMTVIVRYLFPTAARPEPQRRQIRSLL
jgi:hypothetical protein